MQEEVKDFVLLRYADREMAETICEFLVRTFPYAKDGHARVEERPSESRWGSSQPFAIVMDGYMKRFTESQTKACHAARDFEEGYKAAQEKAIARFEELYRSKLKSRSERGAGKEEYPERIKVVDWNDPVGKAAGIRCKRVGQNGYGEYFIYRWSDEGSGWVRLYDQDVDKALADPYNLPEPEEDFIV